MARPTFAEQPVHPMLNDYPAALLPFSFLMDLLHLVTRRKSFADAAWYSLLGGYLTGLAAAATGAMDYFTIPRGRPVRRIADTHAMLNMAGLGLYSLNLMMRCGRDRRSGLFTTLLSGVGVAGLFVSTWFGGHMVYGHGMRVRGKDEPDRAPEVELPGSQRISDLLHDLEHRLAPSEQEVEV